MLQLSPHIDLCKDRWCYWRLHFIPVRTFRQPTTLHLLAWRITSLFYLSDYYGGAPVRGSPAARTGSGGVGFPKTMPALLQLSDMVLSFAKLVYTIDL